MSIFDHVGVAVADYQRSRDFYVATLGTLGVKPIVEFTHDGKNHAGFGIDKPDFWIGDGKAVRSETHVAFRAKSRSEVESFYTAALANGGRDNGKPGLRPEYHERYYGAFVLDPDGNNIEACFRW